MIEVEEMLPCPICKKEVSIANHSNDKDHPMYYIVCGNWDCVAIKTESYADKNILIEAWNRRV